jgi:tetratricopeptide (TPR) repeat protein
LGTARARLVVGRDPAGHLGQQHGSNGDADHADGKLIEAVGIVERRMMKCDLADAAPPSTSAICSAPTVARSRRKRLKAPRRALTPCSQRPGFSGLLDEQGRSDDAIDCLSRALQTAPDYGDAMFNLALLLQRSNRHKEAAEYWRQYLGVDAQSEWAARARRSLKFCEMQLHYCLLSGTVQTNPPTRRP